MTLVMGGTPRRQHATREDAERAVEIYFPAGYTYEVVAISYRCVAGVPKWAVKAYDEKCRFLGYCWDTVEVAEGPK
jgi:hypothetical protein